MIATRTLQAIDEAIQRNTDTEHRSHLGASGIGEPCVRKTWFQWRWAKKQSFCSRMLRLFSRGHHEEPRFVEYLRAIGCQYWDTDPATGKQWRVLGHKGHFGGSCDGIGFGGIVEIPANEYWLGEFKTKGQKYWKRLLEYGMVAEEPKHYAQMQIYMAGLGLKYGLYMVVNKDTDALYAEIIKLDHRELANHTNNSIGIIETQLPPPRISLKPSNMKCGPKWCAYREICHFGKPPDMNCRTCTYSQPVDGGVWVCNKYNQELSKEAQLKGCDLYKMKPGFNE